MLHMIHNAFLFVIKPSMQHRRIQPAGEGENTLVHTNTAYNTCTSEKVFFATWTLGGCC